MRETKSIPVWARIGAGIVVGAATIAIVGMAWIYWHRGMLPAWPWYEWIIFAWSGVAVLPTFTVVALRGLKNPTR
jgi:hypothetical protein